MAHLLQHALYINLDKRTDRREHANAEFAKLGISPERFRAREASHGLLGCAMSHLKCIEIARARGWPQVAIFEDDVTFLDPDLLKKQLEKFVANKDRKWDVIMLAGNNAQPYRLVDDTCIKVTNCFTCTAYIVNGHYYETLFATWSDGMAKLAQFPDLEHVYALDVTWKALQRLDHFYLIIPLTVIQMSDYSDICKKEVDYHECMLTIK